ncbi:MAG: UGSC family (seleno)protein, partial [Chloroflexota bacterium]
MEKRGIPTVTVCTKGFDVLGQAEAKSLGVAALPILTIPVEARFKAKDTEAAADTLIDQIASVFTRSLEKVASEFADKHPPIEIEDSLSRPKQSLSMAPVDVTSIEEATDLFYQQGWTDGLPIVAPTRERVERMLTYTDRERDEVIALIPPRWAKATVEKIAINAVMAGCLPEYGPVILTAVQAMSEPEFGLATIQATTNPVAPLAVVNGPIAKEVGINSRFNVFGPGWRSNATIGRAIRLILINIGGALPGTTDKAIQGQPGKYTFCIAENEDESPWEPLHVERGFPRQVSTVMVIGVQATHNFIVLDRTTRSILQLSADAMITLGTNNMFYGGNTAMALNPQLAAILANEGYSKDDFRQYLFEHARVPLSKFPPDSLGLLKMRRSRYDFGSGETVIPVADRKEEIIVIVTGAGGGHGQYLPTLGTDTVPVIKPITLKNGTPVKSI